MLRLREGGGGEEAREPALEMSEMVQIGGERDGRDGVPDADEERMSIVIATVGSYSYCRMY